MNAKEKKFIKTVWAYYKKSGRHELPWRKTINPYHVLVSEMMLQQTQVDRVIPKYEAFIKKYPTIEKLSKASLADVLTLWQGLGYNRRAKMLLACVQIIVTTHKGVFPTTEIELLALPGVGPYTARAILAFSYNMPTTLIETNIRNVYLHHFFKDKTQVADAELLPYIERTRDERKSREWYYALMDYGSFLKKSSGNANTRSVHFTKQSSFIGSDRQIRGTIVRLLTKNPHTRSKLLIALSQHEDIRIDAQIENLFKEKLIEKHKMHYRLPT